MVVNIMSKEQEQNENIKSFTDYVDKISSGENKEATIFDLASAYVGINYHINHHLNDDEKADLQKSLAEKYNLDNQKLLSEITYSIIEKAIDKAIANKYDVNIFDISMAIDKLPEKLLMKIIAATNSEYLKIENYLSLENVSKETITEIYQNIILTNRCTTEILKSLIDKGFSVPKDSIVHLMNKKMDDVVSGKIKYLLSLNIEYSKDFAKDLIDDIENNIFKDKENIIANYAKYEDVLLKIKDKLKIDLLDDFKTQISKREEVQNFAQDVLTKKIDEFNGYNKEEEKDANYLNIILDLHHLDIIANSSKDNTLTSQFISKIEDYDVTKYNDLVNGIKKNNTITTLNFACNNIGIEGAIAIAGMLEKNTTITTLDLWGNKIGDAGAKAIADALKVNNTITTLELWCNEIGDDGAKAIAGMLEKNETITKLDLWGNKIGADGVIELGRACAGKKNITVVFLNNGYYNLFKLAQGTFTVTTLNLSDNDIDDVGAIALASMLKDNKTITELDLSSNNIGDDGAKALAGMLEKNKTITILNLSSNGIGIEGVVALGRAFAGKDIIVEFGNDKKNGLFKLAQGTFTGTTLDLSSNNIGDDGAIAIANMLKDNKTITKLNLRNNKIGVEGVKVIADALKVNKTITTLDLSYNNIGVEGAKAIADALKVNNTIKTLNLSYNDIGDAGAIALGYACAGKEIEVEFNDDEKNNLFKLAQGTFEGENLDLSRNKIGADGVIVLGRACAGKNIKVEFGNAQKNNLFKKARKYVNKEVESSYFFNIPAFTTGMLGLSTFITLATIITLSILGSQGIIGFDSAAFIAPIASVGVVNLVTFIGFAITEVTSKIMDYKNIDIYNKVHGLAKKQTLLQVLNPCHKVQFVDKVLSEQNNNKETSLIGQ
jgi:Ran GTPase-activating protein (RanGAP) involved in mRNA processing and transport